MKLVIDSSGNTLAPTGQQYDNKTGQWFGSLVRSSGEDGVVLVSITGHLSVNFRAPLDIYKYIIAYIMAHKCFGTFP